MFLQETVTATQAMTDREYHNWTEGAATQPG